LNLKSKKLGGKFELSLKKKKFFWQIIVLSGDGMTMLLLFGSSMVPLNNIVPLFSRNTPVYGRIVMPPYNGKKLAHSGKLPLHDSKNAIPHNGRFIPSLVPNLATNQLIDLATA